MSVMRTAVEKVKRGWTAGAFYKREYNQYCAVGALRSAAGIPDEALTEEEDELDLPSSYGPARDALANVIEEQYPDWFAINGGSNSFNLITSFNDEDNRTQEEVIAVMEKAAIKLEEQE